MKKLSIDQIQALHSFVKKHYVEYYDIELELVDHLANGIEVQWAENKDTSFDTALDIEFKKFGIFGFSDIVDRKINEATHAYLKQMYGVLLGFFTLPKILITIALFLCYFAIGWTFKSEAIAFFLFTGALLMLFFISYGFKWQYELKKINRQSGKKWYLTRVALLGLGSPVILLVAPLLNTLNLLQHRITTDALILFSVIFLTLLTLWVYISIFVFIPYLRTEIHTTIRHYQSN